MNITTPSKQALTIKCNELYESLDLIMADLRSRCDKHCSESAQQLEKAKNLYMDIKYLEPAIDALDE